tara:strand:+ start:2024 stop:2938 length:915 start_codon:yes stop_codon:yes gene_type:complete
MMKKNFTRILFTAVLLFGLQLFAQDDLDSEKSNIQTYTPSKLLNKGDWDFKIFNNLYTQTKFDERGVKKTGVRQNFFTTTIETYTGVSESSRFNIGFILNIKSNTFDKSATSVFSYGNNKVDSRSGLSNIGVSVKFQPFKKVSNFSLQSTFYIPVFKDAPGFYLDKRSYVFENRFFYDKTFGRGKYQFFAELDLVYNFGEKSADASVDENSGERFANNSLGVPVSVFLSYFLSDNFTVYVNSQHYELFDLGNNFTQNYTLLGFGGKYQLNDSLNLEMSYGNFVRGRDNGLGQTFNLGLRYLLTK